MWLYWGSMLLHRSKLHWIFQINTWMYFLGSRLITYSVNVPSLNCKTCFRLLADSSVSLSSFSYSCGSTHKPPLKSKWAIVFSTTIINCLSNQAISIFYISSHTVSIYSFCIWAYRYLGNAWRYTTNAENKSRSSLISLYLWTKLPS